MTSTGTRIGILFHKSPFVSPKGIDQVRLRAISLGLISLGLDVEIIAPVSAPGLLDNGVMVQPLTALNEQGRYDCIKTSYHGSLKYIGSYEGPVVSRIVRVVDETLPERDSSNRAELMELQGIIRQRSSVLVVNNEENRQRWISQYGSKPVIELVPTGCPAVIPAPAKNPFTGLKSNILFLGSLAAPRMVHMLNEAAAKLDQLADIHLVGKNKARMYGGDETCVLDSRIQDHGELPESQIWNYVFHADLGLAFATGPYAFDNDVSKILNYLRGGLPVVSEEHIINNRLIRDTCFGIVFEYGNVDSLVQACKQALCAKMKNSRETVMRFMASEHSWDKRCQSYARIFSRLLEGQSRQKINRQVWK